MPKIVKKTPSEFWEAFVKKTRPKPNLESAVPAAAQPAQVAVSTEQKPRAKREQGPPVFYHLISEVGRGGELKGIIFGRAPTAEEWITGFTPVLYNDDGWKPLHERLKKGDSRLEPVQTIGQMSRSQAKSMAVAHASALDVPVLNP
jgi:hypothetical protein